MTSYKGYIPSTWLNADMLTLIPWLRQWLAGFPTVKVLFLPVSILFSLEGRHYVKSTLKSGGTVHPIKGALLTSIIWIFSVWENFLLLSIISHLKFLLNHIITSAWIHGCLFNTLGYKPILTYLFSCSHGSSMTIGRYFRWLWCSADILTFFSFLNTYLLAFWNHKWSRRIM